MIVKTASDNYSGTNANVYIKIHGETGTTEEIELDNPGEDDFEKGRLVYASCLTDHLDQREL